MTKEKQYQIRFTLNISTIRALLREYNKRPNYALDRARCIKFHAKFEHKLASLEVEHCGKKVPHHLT